jgi:hypothetical protein
MNSANVSLLLFFADGKTATIRFRRACTTMLRPIYQ